MTATANPQGVISEKITRSDVRKATIRAIRAAKANPHRIRLTPGQGNQIRKGLNKG